MKISTKELEHFIETVKTAGRLLCEDELYLDEAQIQQREAALHELSALTGDELMRRLFEPCARNQVRNVFM